MNCTVKYLAQVCDNNTGEIISEQMLYSKAINFPKTIDKFGLRHEEQIKLIKESQELCLALQTQLLGDVEKCPKCGNVLRKQGVFQSDFHDVFTDHKVSIQRLSCTCGWKNKFTINGLYGSALHPELVKLQIEKGAKTSYRKASNDLNKMCYHGRKINNDVTIMRQIETVGELLENIKKSDNWAKPTKLSDTLIVNIDGGHVQHKEAGKHSFEEMIATVYDPKDVTERPDGSKIIAKKISVASAKKDSQITIKKLVANACKKMGMTKATAVTILTDGANNCWSIVKDYELLCASVTRILDWFHIAKHFKMAEHKIPKDKLDLFRKAKWHLWHGRSKTSIIRLEQLKQDINIDAINEELDNLMSYINNNSNNIINYHFRKLKKLPYTSQHAETSVNSIINDRQKNQKMLWTRKGANNILQIRSSIYGVGWEEDWIEAKNQIYNEAISN